MASQTKELDHCNDVIRDASVKPTQCIAFSESSLRDDNTVLGCQPRTVESSVSLWPKPKPKITEQFVLGPMQECQLPCQNSVDTEIMHIPPSHYHYQLLQYA